MKFLYEIFGTILKFIYDFTSNYGLSIVLFSLFAKVITIPLNFKQTRSMQLMKILQPAQDAINKKYANNQQKAQMEIQKLFQKYKYSPLSGCLPLLIQFPILIGLYGALRQPVEYVFKSQEAFDAVHKSFLWIKDLTLSPVAIYKAGGISGDLLYAIILPLISVLLTVIQQKQTSAGQPQQSQMKFMMIFMTVFMAYIVFTVSQGIAMYWTLQTGFGVLQHYIITKYFPLNVAAPVISYRKKTSK